MRQVGLLPCQLKGCVRCASEAIFGEIFGGLLGGSCPLFFFRNQEFLDIHLKFRGGYTWRIIPWLGYVVFFTMVIVFVPDSWGCGTPSKWPNYIHGLQIGGDSFGGYLEDHVPCFQTEIKKFHLPSTIFQGTLLPLRRGRCRKTHMYIPFSKWLITMVIVFVP